MTTYYPNATYERCKHIFELKDESLQLVRDASAVYTFAIQKFGGLGAIFQFFPGSTACAARRQLREAIAEDLIRETAAQYWPDSDKQTLPDALYITLILSPFGGIFEAFTNSCRGWYQEVFKEDIFQLETARFNNKKSFKDIIMDLWVRTRKAFLTLNPFRLLEGVLIFLQSVLNRVLEIGSTQEDKSSLPRFILKALLGILIGGIQIPVKVAKYMLSFSLNLIMEPLLLLGRLLLHFHDSIKSAISNRHTDSLTTTLPCLQGAYNLKQEFKSRTGKVKNTLPADDSGQTNKDVDNSKAKRTYVGTSKAAIRAEAPNPNKKSLVVVLGSPEKIQITQLFITFFQKKEEKAKPMEKSVNEIEKEGKLTEQDIQEIGAQYTTLRQVS